MLKGKSNYDHLFVDRLWNDFGLLLQHAFFLEIMCRSDDGCEYLRFIFEEDVDRNVILDSIQFLVLVD